MPPPVDAVRESNPESGDPPRLLHISFDVVPGNDVDRCDQVVEALDEAYASLREAVIHQRSGVGADIIREFWRRNQGLAFKVTCAIATIDPDAV